MERRVGPNDWGICLNKKIIHQQKLDSRNWTPQDDWQLNERKKEE
jgi:hypothetical protein